MGEAFDNEYGRLGGKLASSFPPGRPRQTTLLYDYVHPPTELIDALDLLGRPSECWATGLRSGRSPTTASTPTRCTSTCSRCSSSTGSPGTTASGRPIPMSWAGRTPSGSILFRIPSSLCGRSLPPTTPTSPEQRPASGSDSSLDANLGDRDTIRRETPSSSSIKGSTSAGSMSGTATSLPMKKTT